MSNKNSYKFKNLNLVGERHGRLTVLRKSKNGRSRWICECDCGNVVELPTFRFFDYKSCGCLEKENKKSLSRWTTKHNATNTRLYRIWRGMKDRCLNPNIEHYNRYGGRGITVCDEWKNSFESFKEWALSVGFNENSTGKEQSIERIDVNGNYEPDNCKWVTCKEQLQNKENTVFVTFCGEKMSMMQFCEKNGITYHHFVRRRLAKGMSAEDILSEWKIRCNHEGYYTIEEAMDFYGVCYETIIQRIHKGKLKAFRVGRRLYIPKGQVVERLPDRNEKGQFLPRAN